MDDSRRRILLGGWGKWSAEHWGIALLIAVGITALMAVGVSRLRLEMTFYSLLPEGSKQVRDLKAIEEQFPVASSIVVVVSADQRNPATEARRTVVQAVDTLSEQLSGSEYSEYIVRVQSKMDQSFFKEHGLLASERKDIERMSRVFADLNLVPLFRHLNDDFEREYSGNEENLSDDEQMVTAQIEGLEQLLATMERAAFQRSVSEEQLSASLDRFLFGSPYFLNRDGTMALLFIQPSFTINDIESYVEFIPRLDRMLKQKAGNLGIEVGLTGLLVVGKDEMVTSQQGLAVSMTIAVVLILLLLVLTFRMFAVPLISGIPLLVGVFWTMGMAGYVMKRLNILTAMYMVALVGLGIDYAIHLMTTYIQEREDGKSFSESVQESMRKSGSGILTGALTTAIAFFALIVAESQVVKELGVIAGLGILCELAAMFILVPALLGFRNHILIKRGRSGARLLHGLGLRYRFMHGLGDRIKRLPGLFAVIPLVLAVIFVLQAPKVEIEGNIMNMEAKGLESVELQDVMVEEFGTAPDVMSVLGSDLEELRSMEDQIEDLASVKRVDSLLPYYPSGEEQAARLPEVELFRLELRSNQVKPELDMEALQEEMIRLEYNLLEISDLAYVAGMEKMLDRLNRLTGLNEEGQKVTTTHLDRIIEQLETDPAAARQGLLAYQQTLVPMLSDTLFTMAGTEAITQEMIPEFILDSYRSEDGTAYLLNIVPTRNPWEQEYRNVLTDQLSTVTDRATGMVLAADQMTQIARTDGVRAAVVALITIFFLLLIDFRNVKLSILTLLPLILSMASLLGIMAVAGIKFDFINVIAIPLLIGIGIDDAVHISHRYVLEGKGQIDRVVARTGAAVLLTSLTTIIGFASFIPSIMRAMRSTGIVLSIAMALAFLFSILFFPSVLLLVAEKLNWNIYPWKRSKK
jgi:predicted RND superfamily exporter protein